MDQKEKKRAKRPIERVAHQGISAPEPRKHGDQCALVDYACDGEPIMVTEAIMQVFCSRMVSCHPFSVIAMLASTSIPQCRAFLPPSIGRHTMGVIPLKNSDVHPFPSSRTLSPVYTFCSLSPSCLVSSHLAPNGSLWASAKSSHGFPELIFVFTP